ncbi:MAG: hypothetical protein AAF664_14390, partial [Planctomycetota bacterium]
TASGEFVDPSLLDDVSGEGELIQVETQSTAPPSDGVLAAVSQIDVIQPEGELTDEEAPEELTPSSSPSTTPSSDSDSSTDEAFAEVTETLVRDVRSGQTIAEDASVDFDIVDTLMRREI